MGEEDTSALLQRRARKQAIRPGTDAFLFVKDKENANSLLIENACKEVPISTIGFLHNVEMPWRDS